MYESKNEPLLSPQEFQSRLLKHLVIALGLLTLSLAVGMVGYRIFEHLSWMDGFLNSAMLLGGMGPVNPPQTDAGKLFAGVYALYSGLVFLIAAALIFTPFFHRLLHRFHWDDDVQ